MFRDDVVSRGVVSKAANQGHAMAHATRLMCVMDAVAHRTMGRQCFGSGKRQTLGHAEAQLSSDSCAPTGEAFHRIMIKPSGGIAKRPSKGTPKHEFTLGSV